MIDGSVKGSRDSGRLSECKGSRGTRGNSLIVSDMLVENDGVVESDIVGKEGENEYVRF